MKQQSKLQWKLEKKNENYNYLRCGSVRGPYLTYCEQCSLVIHNRFDWMLFFHNFFASQRKCLVHHSLHISWVRKPLPFLHFQAVKPWGILWEEALTLMSCLQIATNKLKLNWRYTRPGLTLSIAYIPAPPWLHPYIPLFCCLEVKHGADPLHSH